MVVISQLALYSIVRCNPPQHSQSPNTPIPQMTITDSYSESSYLAGLKCNMDVTAYTGRSTSGSGI